MRLIKYIRIRVKLSHDPQSRACDIAMPLHGVADPYHFDADADPNLSFHYDADPDPAPHQTDSNLRPPAHRPSAAPF